MGGLAWKNARVQSLPSVAPSHFRAACAFAALAFASILVATLIPVAPKNQLLSPFPAYLHADKLGHFFGFALLAGALLWTGRVRPVVAIAVAGGLGASTEALQFLADGRVGRWTDIGIDTAGGALGVALAWALLRMRRREARGAPDQNAQ